MANIPIEKKSGGFPLLPVILGLLALVALLFFLARGCDDNDPATSDGLVEDTLTRDPDAGIGPNDTLGALTGDADGDGDRFESIDAIFADTTMWPSYEGRGVRLDDARVTRVVGDSTFYVQSTDGRRLFVVLEGLGEGATTGSSDDGSQAIQEGQTLDLEGSLVRNSDFARYGLSGSDLESARRMGLMLRARRVSNG